MDTKLSYNAVPGSISYPYCTLLDLFIQQTQKHPDKEAFVFRFGESGRQSATFNEVLIRSRRFASHLVKMGIGRGDTIVNVLPNCMASVYTQMGAWFCGAIPVNILIRSNDPSALVSVFNRTKCKAIVFSDFSKDQWKLVTGIIGSPVNSEIKCSSAPSLKYAILAEKISDNSETYNVDSMVQTPMDELIEFPEVLPEDLAMIIHTSGTTGVPKLVARSHYTFIAVMTEFCHAGKIIESYYNDRHFGWISGTFLPTLINGSTRVSFDNTKTPSPFDAHTLLRIVSEEKCGVALCLPFIFNSLLKADPKPDIPSTLKVMHSGGAPLSSSVVGLLRSYAKDLVYFYGISETGIGAYFISDDNSAYINAIVGIPARGGEIKYVNERGQVVKRGERGYIYLRNKFLFEEYFADEEKTKSAFTLDRWFKTGDIGYMNENGISFCEGRTADIIQRGVHIHPIEIETPMKKMEGVIDVAVVPVPDDTFAEEVCACVIKNSDDITANGILEKCEEIFLLGEHATFSHRPKYVILVEDFPKTINGKLDRKTLSNIAAAKLNLKK